MNQNGLPSNSLGGLPLEQMEDLRTLAGSGVLDVPDDTLASSDAASLVHPHSASHNALPHHSLHGNNHSRNNHSHNHSSSFPSVPAPGLLFQESQLKPSDPLAKLENEVTTINQDLAYFRHVVDFQNLKIEKLTALLIDLLHNKDVPSIIAALRTIQSSDPFNVDDTHDSVDDLISNTVHEVHNQVHDVVHSVVSPPSVLDNGMDPQLHQVAQAAVQAQLKDEPKKRKRARKLSMEKLKHPQASPEGNSMGPRLPADALQQLHQPRQHATLVSHLQQPQNLHPQQTLQLQHSLIIYGQQQQQQQSHQHQQYPQPQQKQLQQQQQSQQQHHQPQQDQALHTFQHQHQHQQQHQHQHQHQQRHQSQQISTQKQPEALPKGMDMPGIEVVSMSELGGRKKPKVSVDFLHNPMTVKEIYDEFTKGFRGQPPLRDMDERFGKHDWRGDSRSKQSKRFQRRKKLCDAIERGVHKYGKTPEEIVNYIEEFRGDKSLTWIMNGNLPADLME